METQKISNSWRITGIILVSLYAIASFIKFFFYPDEESIGRTAVFIIFILISFFLAIKRFGVKDTIVFLVISFGVAWGFETMSVLTGFPFGHYHYTRGPLLGIVPLPLGFGYFSPGVFVWMITSILLDKKDISMKGTDIVLLPFIAAFIQTMWDLCYDPVGSTITRGYVWEEGGVYFGVPVANFLGWIFCAFIMFFVFSLYLSRDKRPRAETTVEDRTFWILPIAAYAVFAIHYVGQALFAKNYEVVAENGHKYWTGDIYGALAVVSIFTVIFVSIYALVRVLRSQENRRLSP